MEDCGRPRFGDSLTGESSQAVGPSDQTAGREWRKSRSGEGIPGCAAELFKPRSMGKRKRTGKKVRKAAARISLRRFWAKLRDTTNHQVIGGLIVGLILVVGGWVLATFSNRTPSLETVALRFVEARELLRADRGGLTALARQFYAEKTPLPSNYPDVQYEPLITPGPEWRVGDAFVPVANVELVLDSSASEISPDDFHLAEFPFVRAHGFSVDRIGYAENIAELNAPLGRHDPTGKRTGASEPADSWHLRLANRDNRTVYDGDYFRIKSLKREADKFKLYVSGSRYFQFVDTCEVLGFEIANAVRACSESEGSGLKTEQLIESSGSGRVFDQLSLRKKHWDIFAFDTRSVGIGVNTLFVRLDCNAGQGEPKHAFYIHDRRIGTASEAMNTLHVVPAGGLSPLRSLSESNFEENHARLTDTVVVEALDELYGEKIGGILRTTQKPLKDVHPVAKEMLSRLNRGSWELFFVGIGIDALNGKVEVSLCLVARCNKQNRLLDSVSDPNLEGAVSLVPFT